MLIAALAAATSLLAQEKKPEGTPLDPKLEKLVRQSVTVCPDSSFFQNEFPQPLPSGMKGTLVRSESARGSCKGQFLAVTTTGGSYWVGAPWFIADAEGKTIEEKLKNFTWKNMQQVFTPVVSRERTPEGLLRVTMNQTTEQGKLPIEGVVDPGGQVFFMGSFRSPSTDGATAHAKVFESLMAASPSRGPATAPVTIVEFSDFQCPSCKHASGNVDPIVAKYGHKVRYVRFDLPLVGFHPWAFQAAVAGRAVYRQKPELFWSYKKAVYENQEQMTAFAIDDFVRGFAQDHELDMKRFDADVASEALRGELLKGVAMAFSNDVRATPTYMVNGVFVDPGDGGADLEKYVAKLLVQ